MMTQKKMGIRRGDRVVVLSGKDKGKKGKVIQALPDKGRVDVYKRQLFSLELQGP